MRSRLEALLLLAAAVALCLQPSDAQRPPRWDFFHLQAAVEPTGSAPTSEAPAPAPANPTPLLLASKAALPPPLEPLAPAIEAAAALQPPPAAEVASSPVAAPPSLSPPPPIPAPEPLPLPAEAVEAPLSAGNPCACTDTGHSGGVNTSGEGSGKGSGEWSSCPVLAAHASLHYTVSQLSAAASGSWQRAARPGHASSLSRPSARLAPLCRLTRSSRALPRAPARRPSLAHCRAPAGSRCRRWLPCWPLLHSCPRFEAPWLQPASPARLAGS